MVTDACDGLEKGPGTCVHQGGVIYHYEEDKFVSQGVDGLLDEVGQEFY